MSSTKTNKLMIYIKWIFAIAIFIGVYFLGYKLLRSDFSEVVNWSIVLILMGLAFLPFTNLIFNKFHDGGWLFSKVIGLAISGWLTWYLSSMLLIKFTNRNCIIVLGLCAGINYLAYAIYKTVIYKQSKKKETQDEIIPDSSIPMINEKKLFSAVITEILFLLAFILWCYAKGYKPEAFGTTEKFMDLGYMTALMRADYMPPEDMWFSGHSINYYYLGQYMIVYITRIVGTTVNYGYNLGLMTIAAFCMTLPYSIVYNLIKNADIPVVVKLAKNESLKIRNQFYLSSLCGMCGILAGLSATITANMHYPLYKHILPFLSKLKGKVMDNSYWFPDPTRYIGHNPETNDKTIHEFPSYSFVLGDLHAHVINIIFVMTVLGILYAFLLCRKGKTIDVVNRPLTDNARFIKELFHPSILLIGFFTGLFQTTNYWDFPIYFVVSGAIILFSNIVICRFKFKDILIMTGLHAVIVLMVGQVVALPFTISFKSFASGIAIVSAHTPLYQLAVLWALPITCVVVFMIYHYNFLRQNKRIVLYSSKEGKGKSKHEKSIHMDRKVKSIILQYIRELNVSDLFAITIGLCAIGLVIMPELIYVVDIYSGSHKRSNTMFKLTYQAYIMLSIAMPFILPSLLLKARKIRYKVMSGIMLVCLVWTMGYIQQAFYNWYGIGDKNRNSDYITLDSTAFLIDESYEDYLAINWLNENITGRPVILEVNGYSFTTTLYQRVSVLTGYPTVLGWETHEWLWRSYETDTLSYPPSVAERRDDIIIIYTSSSYNEVRELINKYNIEYIYVGKMEKERFPDINEEMLKSMGRVIYSVPEDVGNTYILKIE